MTLKPLSKSTLDSGIYPNEIPASDRRTVDDDEIKARLLAVISAAEASEIVHLLDELWAHGEFEIIQAPQTGLLMVTCQDPFETDFFLGEALITSAKVASRGVVGAGTILGDAPEAALLLAAVEALATDGESKLLKPVNALIASLLPRARRRKEKTSKMAAATLVDFDSMQQERVDFGSLGD